MSAETIEWLASIAPGAISPQVAAQAQREVQNEQAARERKHQPKPQRKFGFLEHSASEKD